jgi:hypothetical protein
LKTFNDCAEANNTTDRRGFLRRSSGALLSASAVALITGCESTAGSHSSKRADDDVAILSFALGLEHEAIGAYRISAGSGLLSKPVTDAATLFLGHHQQHPDTLITVIGKNTCFSSVHS